MIELDVLYPGDVYGIEAAMLGDGTDRCQSILLSCGAKLVTINTDFFKQFAADDYLKSLRNRVKPLPTKAAIRKKLAEIPKWMTYKRKLVDEVLKTK